MSAEIVLSSVVAIATVAYTVINLMLWYESRATRCQKLAPLIVPYLKSTASCEALSLYIKNVGEGCAKNVRIKVIKDYLRFGKQDCPLSNFPLFKDGVSIYPSGYELHYLLNWWESIKDNNDEYIELEISYSDINDKLVEKGKRYVVPFNQIKTDYLTPPESYEGQTAYYLKEIHKVLNRILNNK